ncbi:MAG: hypothetical protein JHC30_04005 [Caldisericum sp.]|jgi:hypothetical protein|nr:hypothetical protein [Caldisericum sp.]
MRRNLIELVRKFKQDFVELEIGVMFITEKDFNRMKEYLEEFRKTLERYLNEALVLEEKIKEKQKMLKIE